jgi:Flp pilus assembly protein TadD
VVRLNPEDVEGWSNLGVACQAAGDREAAMEAVQKLQRLDREKATDLMLHLNGH